MAIVLTENEQIIFDKLELVKELIVNKGDDLLELKNDLENLKLKFDQDIKESEEFGKELEKELTDFNKSVSDDRAILINILIVIIIPFILLFLYSEMIFKQF